MLANFFDKTKPINSLAIGVIFSLYYFVFFILQENPAFTVVSAFEIGGYLFLNLLFLFLSGVVFIKNGMSNGNLYASFIMVLLYGMFPFVFQMDKTLFVLLFFVLFYQKISTLDENTNTISKLFDSGLYIGVSVLLFNWAILFFPLIFLALLLFKKINMRYLIVPIIGLLVPAFLFFAYCFLIDALQLFYQIFDFSISLEWVNYGTSLKQIPMLVIAIIGFISIIMVLPKIMAVSNRYRSQYTIALISLFIGVFLIGITPLKNGSELLYVFLPFALMIAGFVKIIEKKLMKELVLLGLALLSVVLFTLNL